MRWMELTLQITNDFGLHARPAVLFAQKASEFKAQLFLNKDGKQANAKSILGIMGLGVAQHDIIVLSGEGPDADQAMNALAQMIKNNFNEI